MFRLARLPALAAALTLTAAAAPPWYAGALVGLEVGPTGAQFGHSDPNDARYAARFDGRQIVRETVAAGGEYLVAWARDGDFAYYDSRLLPKAPGLGERDPLREAVDEAALSRLPVIAYCVVQQGGHFLNAHPEWAMRDPEGRPIGRFCFNSGYLAAMKEIVAEQLAYGIAGFHLDMLDQGFGPPYGCWCDTCRAEFQKEHGHPMPRGATWDEAWDRMLDFRYRTSERFQRALYAHIKMLNPRATVDYNYHGNPPFSFEVGQRPVQHAGNGDFITGETGVWGFSALTVGLNAAFYRAAVPHQRVQVAMQRGVRMYHDQTTRPLADLRWELLTLLAHGAFVTLVDKTGFDGALDLAAYGRFGAAFADARARRPHFGQMPVADVGLWFSSRTRDWLGREQPAGYFQGFLGAHKAMVYEHLPYGVLLDEHVTAAALRAFPVVLVPHAAILSASEAALLRGYVGEGGALILTGWTGQFDSLGRPLPDTLLGDLVGARVQERLGSQDNWMRFPAPAPDAPFAPDVPADWPFLVKGPATVYAPTTATPVGELFKPHRTTRQREGREGTDWPMSPDMAVGPAVLVNRVGRGTVLTFAGAPDFATAGEHHITETRRLLADAVRRLHPRPRVRVTAPAHVEAVVTDEPAVRVLRVHLLGYLTPPQTTPPTGRPAVIPRPMEDLPLFRAEIETTERLRGARAYSPATRLERRGRRVEVQVNDVHEVVLLRY
ncbi:MAG: alpha-amylase family protein [Limisphaerales bacterium]